MYLFESTCRIQIDAQAGAARHQELIRGPHGLAQHFPAAAYDPAILSYYLQSGHMASVQTKRGCEHGCVYCYARPTHSYLNLSPGLDFEMWLGPAPAKPYNDIQCSYNWYFVYDYCIGWIGSWGVHHIDSALWGAPEFCTGKIDLQGTAVFPTEGLANTSISWRVEALAENGVRMIFTDDSGQPHGVRFEGDRGWVHVVRGGIQAEPASLLKLTLRPDDRHLYESHSHHGHWMDCIRTRRDPVSNVDAGFAATVFTIVSDIATRTGRKLTLRALRAPACWQPARAHFHFSNPGSDYQL